MLRGDDLADYALSKIGTPYFYGAKMQVLTESLMAQMHKLYPKTVDKEYMAIARSKGIVGKVCTDCSGLIGAFRGKQIGSAQLYQTAYRRLPITDWQKWARGVVVWRNGHVGVYVGTENGIPMVVEAKGLAYGTVLSRMESGAWAYGLTFSDIEYDYKEPSATMIHKPNPYTEPKRIIKKGCRGEDVMWVQYALRQAGYAFPFTYKGKSYGGVDVDGVAGKITDAAIRAFQQSCKITIDGKVGKVTRDYLSRL